MTNRVMVVEDEEGVRKLAEAILKKGGFEVTPMPTAEAALQKYKPGDYDCLLVDFVLGNGLDGVEFIRQIRETDKRVGIVMATGTVDLAELAVEGLSVWSCIKKPFNQGFLLEKVNQACELAAMGEEKIRDIGTRVNIETEKIRTLRRDLRAETTILPPGVLI